VIVDRLGFRPSHAATTLVRGTPRTVAVVVAHMTRPSTVVRVASALAVLAEEGYDAIVCNVDTPRERDRHLETLLPTHRADGVLAISLPLCREQLAQFGRAGVTLVSVDTITPGVPQTIVDDVAGVRRFCAVNGEAYGTYGMPSDSMDDLFDRPDVVLADPAAHIVVARRGEEAVATAMIFESDGVASVQWVGTVPAARGLGLGAVVTTAVTNLAFAHGAASVTLQASPMGEPVYLALGYEPLFRYTEYVRWPRPPRD